MLHSGIIKGAQHLSKGKVKAYNDAISSVSTDNYWPKDEYSQRLIISHIHWSNPICNTCGKKEHNDPTFKNKGLIP